jgi:soluble lytic murein transglycosylase
MNRLFLLSVLWGAPVVVAAESADIRQAILLYNESPARAASALTQARQRAPDLSSALSVLEADALLRAGRRMAARSLASRSSKDDRWGHWAAWVEARAAMPDDCQGSLRALKKVRSDPPWVSTPEILDLTARAHGKCGDHTNLEAILKGLAIKYPETSVGAAALKRIVLTPSEQVQRARAFERARLYPQALSILRGIEGAEARTEARFAIAQILLTRTRDNFDESARVFQEICLEQGARSEEACFLAAKALGRGSDVIGALSGFESYRRRYPKGRFADDAQFFGGFLRYETSRYQQARQVFLRITKGTWRKAARWYAAWSAYLAGDCGVAQPEFEAMSKELAGSNDGRRAAYWSLRCIEQSDPIEAERRAVRLVGESRFDWYTLLLRARYVDRFGDITLPRTSEAIRNTSPPVFTQSINEIRRLAEMGLTRFAQRALAVLAPRLRAAGYWQLEVGLAGEVGDWRRALQATLNARGRIFRGQPDASDVALWRSAYPLGFRAEVTDSAKMNDLDPALIYSFIRKESAFAPSAVSHAHAVGLMQLLPRTAQKIRRATGEGNQAQPQARENDLFDPGVNVRLGGWYIAALSHRFGGQLPLVAAAYNAGPGSLTSWFRGRPSVATDVFVESIPYRETREYVKRLVRTLVIYHLVHGQPAGVGDRKLIPLNLDLTARQGVDF